MIVRILCSLVLLAVAGAANAVPISVSQSQNIVSDGQLFNFNFGPLAASDGTGGQLSITLSGDFSSRNPPPLSEGATVSLDVAGGMLELYNDSSSAAIFSNTIAGLSLSSTTFAGGGNDVTLGYVFDISGALLDLILGDSNISVDVQNTSDVSASLGSNAFVSVGFDYESGSSPSVPEPTTLLLGLAGVAAALSRRKLAR